MGNTGNLPIVAMFVFGLTFMVLAGSTAAYSCQKTSHLQRAPGVVREASKRRAAIQYEVAGRSYTLSETRIGALGARGVGEEVTILYDPANPERAMVESFTTQWLLASVYAVVGSIAWLLAAVLLVLRRQGGRH